MLDKKDAYWLVFVSSALALILVRLSELVWSLTPCSLCIYQRIPYFILLFISCLSIGLPSWRKYTIYAVIFLYIIEIILASYHIGVEHYWIEDTYTCSAGNLAEFLNLGQVLSSCSEVKFRFMNLSMAEWNLLYASILLYRFFKIEKKND